MGELRGIACVDIEASENRIGHMAYAAQLAGRRILTRIASS
jgi:hypothetical protein